MKCLELTKSLEHRAKIPTNIQRSLQVSSKLLFDICSLALPYLFSCSWPTPIDGSVPRTFIPYSVMLQRAWRGVLQSSIAKPHRANCTEIQGGGASTTCLLDSIPSHLPCQLRPSCGNLSQRVTQSPWSSSTSMCEFCTNKIEIILLAWERIILIRNFLWKQTLQTTSWSPNLNQENSSISKYDLRMKLILIVRDKKCCMEDSKNYLRLGGGEVRWE